MSTAYLLGLIDKLAIPLLTAHRKVPSRGSRALTKGFRLVREFVIAREEAAAAFRHPAISFTVTVVVEIMRVRVEFFLSACGA